MLYYEPGCEYHTPLLLRLFPYLCDLYFVIRTLSAVVVEN